MKRHPLLLVLILFLCLPLRPALAGETIIFDGTDMTLLKPHPKLGGNSSLFPTMDSLANTITVTAGTVGGEVFGGWSDSGNADSNTVSITGGTIGGFVFGGWSDSGNANSNKVTISGGTIDGFAFGGWSDSGNADSNKVTISGGTITGNVYGGLSFSGNVNTNTVTISGGDVSAEVYGGWSDSGDALSNNVTITGGTIGYNVYGGYSGSGNTTHNSVSISNGTIDYNVYGGNSYSGAVSANSVTISDGTIKEEVYGGYSTTGDVSANKVSITGGTITGNVYGGYSDSGDVSANSVTITAGMIGGDATGGYSYSGDVTANTVTVTGGIAYGIIGGESNSSNVSANKVSITGGTIQNYVYGGYSDSGNVSSNTVTITGGSITWNVYGGYSQDGDALNNSVSITGGSIGGDVIGGFSDSAKVSGNNITITGGTIGYSVLGGDSISGKVSANSVTITGGTIGENVTGGFSYQNDVLSNTVTISGGTIDQSVYGGAISDSGNVSANTVTITGGTIGENVIGGYSYSGNGDVTHNTVTLGRGARLAATSSLFGGSGGSTGDLFTGNTLNVLEWQGTVTNVRNFENYAFALPANIAHGDTLLTVTGTADLTDGAGRSSKVTNLTITSGGRAQQVGETFTLIDASAGTLITSGINTTTRGSKGISLFYDFALETNALPNSLTATITGVQVNPQTKAFAEGRAANMAFINQGADLAAEQGIGAALAATQDADGNNVRGFTGFSTISSGSSRYETGSHVDVDGVSLLAGLAWNAPLPANNLLLGAFFEAGWGNYDSHNSFSNAANVKGNGDTNYYGGGLLARYELTEGQLKGLYAEASARAGWTTTDFSSSDLRGHTGQDADYDSGALYYGAHAGLGYIWQATEKVSLDMSAKYLWTHQDSDSVSVRNEPVSFKAADSQRIRTGARLSYTISEQVTPYIGAAYEYEFDGDARATVYGFDIDTPSLEGGTGIGEFGLSLKPAADSAFTADVAIQGYTGTREGVTGSFQLRYEF